MENQFYDAAQLLADQIQTELKKHESKVLELLELLEQKQISAKHTVDDTCAEILKQVKALQFRRKECDKITTGLTFRLKKLDNTFHEAQEQTKSSFEEQKKNLEQNLQFLREEFTKVVALVNETAGMVKRQQANLALCEKNFSESLEKQFRAVCDNAFDTNISITGLNSKVDLFSETIKSELTKQFNTFAEEIETKQKQTERENEKKFKQIEKELLTIKREKFLSFSDLDGGRVAIARNKICVHSSRYSPRKDLSVNWTSLLMVLSMIAITGLGVYAFSAGWAPALQLSFATCAANAILFILLPKNSSLFSIKETPAWHHIVSMKKDFEKSLEISFFVDKETSRHIHDFISRE